MSLKYSSTTADYLVWSDAMNLIRKLAKDGNYKISLLIALGCFTGLRISDILALRWKQILGTDEFTVIEKKTNKVRTIRINAQLGQHIKECYEQMGADYEGVLGRLRSEVLIKKFAKKFLDDGSFRSLKDNLVQKNGEEAFRAAHTLKGVCQNLGFDNLYKASFDITEKLRGRDTEGCEELLAKVEEQYNNTVDAIHMMED